MGHLTPAIGSMADVPTDLMDQIHRLEELFTVPQAKLKEITNQFVGELTKGLTVEGGSIVSFLHTPHTTVLEH